MDTVEDNLVRILQGDPVQESEEFCDFSLQDQNQILGEFVCVKLCCFCRFKLR
jgi:hypothetical protein